MLGDSPSSNFAVQQNAYLDALLNAGPGHLVLYNNQVAMQNASAQYNALNSLQQASNPLHMQGNALANCASHIVKKNVRGQSYSEWREGYEGRKGMVEASGYPISDREQALWDCDLAEWREMEAC